VTRPQPLPAEHGNVQMGLIGRGITRSRTPAMHMEEAAAQGLSAIYRIHDMDDPDNAAVSLEAMLDRLEGQGYAGVNITYPFKINVIPHLHDLSANAAAVGAVNTVIFRDGYRKGHNTDLWGFAESFRRSMADVRRDHALLLGAGGAGGAVAHALVGTCGVTRLSIHDSDTARAKALADQVSTRWKLPVQVEANLDRLMAEEPPSGVVNATPMGMAKLPGSAFPATLLHPSMWVADVVYVPLETELLRSARLAGCRTLSGAGMAIFQAVRAFELFTGRPADPARMRATFESLGA
jgi:shikimate dehydrogenase